MEEEQPGRWSARTMVALAAAGVFAAIGVGIGLVGGLVGTRRQDAPTADGRNRPER